MFRLFVRCIKTGQPFSLVTRECYGRGYRFAFRPEDGGQTIVTVEGSEEVEIHPRGQYLLRRVMTFTPQARAKA
jgi:hypothetical protein